MVADRLGSEQDREAGRAKGRATLEALSKRSKVSQCLEMQELLKGDIMSVKTASALRATLIKAWDQLEERIRILRAVPLPGSLSHEKVKRGKRALGALPDVMLRYSGAPGASTSCEMHDAPLPEANQANQANQEQAPDSPALAHLVQE